MADDLDALARLVNEQRQAKNAERDRPFAVADWPDRTEDQKDLDRRIASAVAARAVADAGLANERMRAQLFALAAHLPAIRRALTIAATTAEYEADAKQYRAAIQALGISEEGGDRG